jgi:hypothetical protein
MPSKQETVHLEIATPSERLQLFQNLSRQFNLSLTSDIQCIIAKLHSYKMADIYMLLRLADEKREMRGDEKSMLFKHVIIF